jgi:hypothetical protein
MVFVVEGNKINALGKKKKTQLVQVLRALLNTTCTIQTQWSCINKARTRMHTNTVGFISYREKAQRNTQGMVFTLAN